ncbi:type 2 periplasmic-binding domain-containing protein [Vallitalea okinawensis]|uniref:extracellular solute-binding protein n=1 Tax=Vallitalea okinawensis TaxID=2078660 RepID=UPI000CFD887C|nr:extracellular solute-binding protein [Vallitalea okinawensis]
MNLKKVVALALVGAIGISSILTGCSKAEEEKVVTEKKEVAASDNFNATGYPIVNETITLDVIFNSHPNTIELNEMPFFQELEKKTNIKLNVETIRSGWTEKKNLVLASGDLPDIFFGEGLKDTDLLNNKDFFVDMNSYISEYAPNIQKMFEEEPVTEKMATVPNTGEIYGLPNVRPFRPNVGDTWFINQEWLDNLGLEMPQSTEEFYEVLKAFKEQDANGNGDPNDEIPFNFNPVEPNNSNKYFTWRGILGSFGVTNDRFGDNVYLRDGNVQYVTVAEGYKEAVQYMHRLYSEGLIYSEVLTQDNYNKSGKTPDVAQLGAGVHWQAAVLFGQWADQYAVLPPLEGPRGDRTVVTDPTKIRMKKNTFSITSANPYPEATMRWVNELYDPEASLQLFFGSIGPCIEKKDDGYVVLDPTEESGLDAGSWKWTNAPADRAPMYASKSIEEQTTIPEFHKIKLGYEDVLTPYMEPESNTFPMVIWTPDISEELATLKNDIGTYAGTKTAEWIVNGGIEEEWDKYIDDINNMGLERYLEIYQEAYDNFMK